MCMEIVDLIKYAMVPATENMKRRNVWYRTWMTGKLISVEMIHIYSAIKSVSGEIMIRESAMKKGPNLGMVDQTFSLTELYNH